MAPVEPKPVNFGLAPVFSNRFVGAGAWLLALNENNDPGPEADMEPAVPADPNIELVEAGLEADVALTPIPKRFLTADGCGAAGEDVACGGAAGGAIFEDKIK